MGSELAINPVESLTFMSDIAYADCTLNADEPGLGGVEGERVSNLPEWTASLRWNYSFPLSGRWPLPVPSRAGLINARICASASGGANTLL